MRPSFKYVYTIRAKNSCGQTYYFVSGVTQSGKMLVDGYSLAFIYRHKKDAEKGLPDLKAEYKGLKDWAIEYRTLTVEEYNNYFDVMNHGFGINRK